MKHKEQQCLPKTIKNGKQMFTTECVGLVLAGLAASGAASGQGPRRLPRAPVGRSAQLPCACLHAGLRLQHRRLCGVLHEHCMQSGLAMCFCRATFVVLDTWRYWGFHSTDDPESQSITARHRSPTASMCISMLNAAAPLHCPAD